MFTLSQIVLAHSKVKSGADFPAYIKEIKSFGVLSFETWVSDSHTVYFGANNFQLKSEAHYDALTIAQKSDPSAFLDYLKMHQKGDSDYLTFCKHCALTGIERWVVDLQALTCTYFDVANNEILVEQIPQ